MVLMKLSAASFWALVALAVALNAGRALTQSNNAVKEKLKVMVLYESLCPDSVRFINSQLGPNYDALKDYIDVTLVPFGKSKSINNNGLYQFFCQHGPKECEGNREQLCVLQQTTDQEAQVNFVVCQMRKRDVIDIRECAESFGLSSDIDDCMHNGLGTSLQLESERVTNLYKPQFVPTIVYDGVFDQQLQDNSLRDFRGTVCYLLQRRGDISFHSEVCQ
ncbi:GILT-like protein 1 [Musca vetustissima]|uniref:GILT-like protein 1 n=1 Tax=Musca vetustissima TaxID=27455 RepID=UPI002AB6C880|nr:GILT-like protein 1 [Musca vetustissima]